MALSTPTADLQLAYSVDPASGAVIADLVLTPGGDLKMVSGINRLTQEVLRWLLTPLGANPLDSSYGNPMFSLLGRPGSPDVNVFSSMVAQCEGAFLVRQQAAAALGFLSVDEQVDHFENTQVSVGQGGAPGGVQLPIGTVTISFTIVSRAGQAQLVQLPFPITVGA